MEAGSRCASGAPCTFLRTKSFYYSLTYLFIFFVVQSVKDCSIFLNPSVPAYGGRCKCGNGTVWKHVQPAGWVVLEGGGLRCPLCEEVHQILMRRRAARHKARRATRAASAHTQEA